MQICGLGGAQVSSCKLCGSPLCLLLCIREEHRSLGKEGEPCTAFANILKSAALRIRCWDGTRIRELIHSLFRRCGSLAIILGKIWSPLRLLIKIDWHLLKSFLSNLNASFTQQTATERFRINLSRCEWKIYMMLTSTWLFLSVLW